MTKYYSNHSSCYFPPIQPQPPICNVPPENTQPHEIGIEYALFSATAPADNPNPIAPSNPVAFPISITSGKNIEQRGTTQFNLAEPGTYLIAFRVNTEEAGQLQIALNGVGQPYTTFGQAAATSDISGTTIVTTTSENTLLSVINPATQTTNITVAENAGGTGATVSTLSIFRLK